MEIRLWRYGQFAGLTLPISVRRVPLRFRHGVAFRHSPRAGFARAVVVSAVLAPP
jgi:hypothetical protein